MRPERWNQIERLFLQASELPPDERERFLREACNGDETLRQELNSLLACDIPERPLVRGSFSPPGSAPIDTTAPAVADLADRRIGPYRLVRLLGRGGMGSVHLAVRDDDHFHKEVAIKLLKRGMDTDFMLHRFRQERQILANLEHPFIARLLDGGATDDGLPYFVMEYVDGSPITTYCADHTLDLVERLRLFRLVCEAVQYAHQHLVIHRDLKPGNILITKERIPKLLDFGIAKLMGPDPATELPTLTGAGHRMMTPDYASPEQFLGQTISTSSDIYSLGAVLYELLTGQRPHRFECDSLAAMEKAICELEPEKPSTVVVRGRQDPPRLRKQRSRQLSGDLDNIILTALRKEPQRRYPSVSEFSEDIRRHLEGLPVTARDDRFSYRMGKFVRRHKLGVMAASLVIASLAGGIVSTTFQARRAERRFQLVRQLGNAVLFDLQAQAERLPGSTALQVSMVQTVVQYLDSLARDSGGDPALDLEIAKAYYHAACVEGHPFRPNLGLTRIAAGHFEKAREIFERLSHRIETRAEAIPELVNTHIDAACVAEVLGHPSAVSAHLDKAAAIVAQVSTQRDAQLHPRTLAALYYRLGDDESRRGNRDLEIGYYQKAVEVCRKWAETDPSTEALSSLRAAYSQLGNGQAHAGDLYGARETFGIALKLAEELLNRPGSGTVERYGLTGMHHIFGDMLGAPDDPNLGDAAGALSHYRTAKALSEGFAAADPKDVNARRNVAGSCRRVGLMLLNDSPREALELYRRAQGISSELSSKDPSNIYYRSALADALLGVSQALKKLNKKEEALQNLLRVIELQKSIEAVAPDRVWLLRTTPRAYMVAGDVLAELGDASKALENYQAGLAAANKTLERVSTSLHHALDRADVLEAMGRFFMTQASKAGSIRGRRAELRAEARSCFQKALSIWQDWMRHKVAAPYAERRETQTIGYLAECNQL